jgi:hypothetical protein
MRPLVNLSSRPFQNRRLFWLTILLLFVFPAYFGIDALGTLAQRKAELEALDAQIQRLQLSAKSDNKQGSANVTISADRNSGRHRTQSAGGRPGAESRGGPD